MRSGDPGGSARVYEAVERSTMTNPNDDDAVLRSARTQSLRAALLWRLAEIERRESGIVTARLDVLRQELDDLAQLYPGGLSEAERGLDDLDGGLDAIK